MTSLADWVKDPNWIPQLILKIEPAFPLSRNLGSWTLEDGTDYTYYIDHSEVGKPNSVIFCSDSDGSITKWTEVGSKASVESTQNSWYYESSSGKLYFHAEGVDSWADHLASFFWLYFTNINPESNLLVIDGKPVRVLLHDSSVPEISASISSFYSGTIEQSLGSVELINAGGELDEWYWKYIWVRKRMVAELGGVGGTYPTDFTTLWYGWTGKVVWTEEMVRIEVEDLRKVTPFI